MAYSVAQQFFINQLRSHISMRYTAASGSSYILPAKLSDHELWEDIRNGLSFFNTFPPVLTTISLKDIFVSTELPSESDPSAPELETSESVLIGVIINCALFYTGMRLQWFEAGKHFRYSDNGISIERAKQGDYQNIIGSNILTWVNTILPGIKKSMALDSIHLKGLWSGMVAMPRSLTRGLRGTRLGSGV